MKVALMFLTLAAYLPAILVAAGMPLPLTPLELCMWAACVSAIGGFAAGWRVSDQWSEILKTALHTMVLGVGLVLSAAYWTVGGDPAMQWMAIGLSGVLSLGGLASIDWAVDLARRKAEAQFRDTMQRAEREKEDSDP